MSEWEKKRREDAAKDNPKKELLNALAERLKQLPIKKQLLLKEFLKSLQ